MMNANAIIGKTLGELADELEPKRSRAEQALDLIRFANSVQEFLRNGADMMSAKGVIVRTLSDENDTIGKDELCDFSLQEILHKRPDLTTAKVKYTNDFFGSLVLRVIP